MMIDKELNRRVNRRLNKLSLEEASSDLQDVATIHFRFPHAINHIQLLGDMPPEDGEPFGFIRSEGPPVELDPSIGKHETRPIKQHVATDLLRHVACDLEKNSNLYWRLRNESFEVEHVRTWLQHPFEGVRGCGQETARFRF